MNIDKDVEFLKKAKQRYFENNKVTGGAGTVFRMIAHGAVKFIPVAGGIINSGIAGVGTKAIGAAAIKYYIDGASIEEAREIFKKENSGDKIDVSKIQDDEGVK